MTHRATGPRIVAPQSEPVREASMASEWRRDNDITSLDIAQITMSPTLLTQTIRKTQLMTLGNALRESGYPAPLPVRVVRANNATTQYLLIGGHRLYRAAKNVLATGISLGVEEIERIQRVPVVIDTGSNDASPIVGLLADIDRVKPQPAMVAQVLANVKQRSGWSNLAIGIAFGLSEGKVQGYISVSERPELLHAVEGGLGITIAIALGQATDQQRSAELLDLWKTGTRLKVGDVTRVRKSSVIDDAVRSPSRTLPDYGGMDDLTDERAAHLLAVTRLCVDDPQERTPRSWEMLEQAHTLMTALLATRSSPAERVR